MGWATPCSMQSIGPPLGQCPRDVVGMWPWLTLGHWHEQGLGFPGTRESSSESGTGLGRWGPAWGTSLVGGHVGEWVPTCDWEPTGRDSAQPPGLRRGLLSGTPPGTCVHTPETRTGGPQTPTDCKVTRSTNRPARPTFREPRLEAARLTSALSPQVTQLDQRLAHPEHAAPAARTAPWRPPRGAALQRGGGAGRPALGRQLHQPRLFLPSNAPAHPTNR